MSTIPPICQNAYFHDFCDWSTEYDEIQAFKKLIDMTWTVTQMATGFFGSFTIATFALKFVQLRAIQPLRKMEGLVAYLGVATTSVFFTLELILQDKFPQEISPIPYINIGLTSIAVAAGTLLAIEDRMQMLARIPSRTLAGRGITAVTAASAA